MQVLPLGLAAVVELLEDESIGDVECVVAGGFRRGRVFGEVVEQVEFDDICLFFVVDVCELLLEGAVECLDAFGVVTHELFEPLLQPIIIYSRTSISEVSLITLVELVMRLLLLHQLRVELLYRHLPSR